MISKSMMVYINNQDGSVSPCDHATGKTYVEASRHPLGY